MATTSITSPLVSPPENNEELPGYSRAGADPVLAQADASHACRMEYSCSLFGSDGQALMTLFVRSRAPSKQTLPMFYEGDSITGAVEISPPKSITVKGISISVSHLIFSFL
jgi:hypothetical protein